MSIDLFSKTNVISELVQLSFHDPNNITKFSRTDEEWKLALFRENIL